MGRAAGHGVEAEGASVERGLGLFVEGRFFSAAGRREVRDEAVFVGVPAPRGVDLAGAAVDGAFESIDVVAEAVVVPDFVAELVADGVVEGDDAAAAGAAVDLDAVGVFAAIVVRGELGGDVRVAAFAATGGAVEAVVCVVDAVGDELFADALAHVAGVPAAFAFIEVFEQRAGGHHDFAERERGVLRDGEAAGRDGLEILAVRLGVFRKSEGVARRGEHADVDGVDEELRGRADFYPGEIAGECALADLEREAGDDGFRREHAAPRVGGVGERVVFEVAVAEPLPADAFELQRLSARHARGAAAVVNRRAVARAGFGADHFAVERLVLREVNVAHPTAVRRFDLDDGVLF